MLPTSSVPNTSSLIKAQDLREKWVLSQDTLVVRQVVCDVERRE
jgi:hypothetical protein